MVSARKRDRPRKTKPKSRVGAKRNTEHARAVRGLQAFIADIEGKQLEAERKTNPTLLLTFYELHDKDTTYAAGPSKRKAGADPAFETMLRCEAVAIAHSSVRGQATIRALQRLQRRAPKPSAGRFVYGSARARELLTWFEKQRPSDARDTLLRPLRRAVARKHAFALLRCGVTGLRKIFRVRHWTSETSRMRRARCCTHGS